MDALGCNSAWRRTATDAVRCVYNFVICAIFGAHPNAVWTADVSWAVTSGADASGPVGWMPLSNSCCTDVYTVVIAGGGGGSAVLGGSGGGSAVLGCSCGGYTAGGCGGGCGGGGAAVQEETSDRAAAVLQSPERQ